MTDIVERLRAYVEYVRCGTAPKEYLEWEAADEIERLRALLREAVLYDSQIIHMESWWRKVRDALEPKP
jgi:hypothetical protein